MASLSDEETARALCAFQHTEPLPTQYRQPLQQSLYPPRLAPNGLATFGYPSNSTYHIAPVSRRNEAASVLVGMNSPSTSSSDWQRLQQRAIQEQIEQQQRELQQQIQQQQRRDMHVQLQRMQSQIQQQEQTQVQQMQRIEQPRYSTGEEFEQTRWSNVVNTSSFQGGGSQEMQQSRQVYDGRYGRSQVPIRPATVSTPTTTSSFGSEYRASSQPGVPMNRNNDMFAPQPVPQSAQSHLQARNGENVETIAFHKWERRDTTLFSGIPTDTTKAFQMQNAQRYLPQQPQPYYPITGREHSRQETTTQRKANTSNNDAFLNGVMKNFPSSGGYDGNSPASADASTGFNYAEARINKTLFNSIQTQGRIPNLTGMQMQEQMNVQPRPSVPPAGSTVIPGVALASPSVRLLTMRDILNGEDAPNKVDSSRNRQRGGKQKRDTTKRKNPRKLSPTKRRRMPQQVNKQRSQPLQSNRSVGGIVSRQVASPTPSNSGIKPTTPMYRAFMESRAARASEQAAGVTSTSPSTPSVLQAHAAQLLTKSDRQMSVTPTNFIAGPVNMRKVDTESQHCYPSNMCRSDQRSIINTNASAESTTKPKIPLHNSDHSTTESLQKVDKHEALVSGRVHCADDFDSPMDQASEQQQQQYCAQPSVSTTVVGNVQTLIKLDVVGSSKAGITSKKRRRPFAGSNQSTTGGAQKPSTRGLSKTTTAATAPTSFSGIQTPTASDLPREQNRTVVIFCKRDFMRYQAAKIWRKYQEQLKKHEEWREVRVAGKRTRYLNSRYDELQRTQKRTYTRSSKPRRKSSQAAKGTRSRKEPLFTAESASVGSTKSLPVDNEGAEICTARETDPKGGCESADSGVLFSVDDAHSLSEKSCASDSDVLVATPFSSESSQQPPLPIEDKTKSAVEPSVARDPAHGTMGGSMTHSELDGATSDGNNEAVVNACLHNSDTVADALSSDYLEPPSNAREAIPVVTNTALENMSPSVANVTSSGSTEVTDTVTTIADETPITESLSSCRIDATSPGLDSSIDTTVVVAPKGNVATVAVADLSFNGSIKSVNSVPNDVPGNVVGESVSVDVVVASMGVKQTTDEESEASLSDVKRLGEEIIPDKPTGTNPASI